MNMKLRAAFHHKKQNNLSHLQMQITGRILNLFALTKLRYHREVEVFLDNDDGVWKKQNKICIPNGDLELKLKIIVYSHCRTMGHRGAEVT